jgi:colanic acid biosynthesis glycosyl transferase WcaI
LILVVSQYFRPEPNIALSDVAEALTRLGEAVVVITSHPNHPNGRFYPEVTSIMPTCERHGKLTIWRVTTYPCRSTSKVGRFVSYMSFCLSAFLCSLFVARRCKVAYVYQTPFTSALAVLWLKLAQSTRLAYMVVDLWPESFTATGVAPGGPTMDLMYWYSRAINRAADHIFASTQGTRARYLADGIPAERVSFTPVWVEGIPAQYRLQPPEPQPGRFRVVYAGNLGPAQRLDTLLLAAHKLVGDPDFEFHLYGNGTAEAELLAMKDRLQLHNVTFGGLVSPALAFQHSREADAVLLHLANSPHFRHTIPSKIVSLLASGSVLLCGVTGETSDLVRQYEAGLIFEPESPDDLVRVLREARALDASKRANLRERAWDLYAEVFEKGRVLDEHLSVTRSLLAR